MADAFEQFFAQNEIQQAIPAPTRSRRVVIPPAVVYPHTCLRGRSRHSPSVFDGDSPTSDMVWLPFEHQVRTAEESEDIQTALTAARVSHQTSMHLTDLIISAAQTICREDSRLSFAPSLSPFLGGLNIIARVISSYRISTGVAMESYTAGDALQTALRVERELAMVHAIFPPGVFDGGVDNGSALVPSSVLPFGTDLAYLERAVEAQRDYYSDRELELAVSHISGGVAEGKDTELELAISEGPFGVLPQ